VRHGQTASSTRGAYSGHTDIPLTDTGREQARRAGDRLAGAGVDAVCSSPLRRAAETAEAIAQATGAPLRIDERLVEVDYGPLEGLDRDSARERFGAPFENWRLDPYGSPLPGIEPLNEVLGRARSATSDALAAFERPVLVGHQGILRLVLVVLGRIEPSAYFSTRVPEAEPIEIVAPTIGRG
jgi:broad specificity phosphatase PhoE